MGKITLFLLLLIPFVANGLDNKFVKAIHAVETGTRLGAIKGDNGRALGPLQIHKACWIDSRVPGNYQQCSNLFYSIKVMEAICLRYEPKALKENDFESLARLWNAGPNWRKRLKATDSYWLKVKKHLSR
jgi:hypothetical protein